MAGSMKKLYKACSYVNSYKELGDICFEWVYYLEESISRTRKTSWPSLKAGVAGHLSLLGSISPISRELPQGLSFISWIVGIFITGSVFQMAVSHHM